MSVAANRQAANPSFEPRWIDEAERAVSALLTEAVAAIRARVTQNGKISSSALEREQHAVHGLAWLATYAEIVRQLNAYATRMTETGRFGEPERLLTAIGLGESLAQIFGGIPMNQAEFVRLAAR